MYTLMKCFRRNFIYWKRAWSSNKKKHFTTKSCTFRWLSCLKKLWRFYGIYIYLCKDFSNKNWSVKTKREYLEGACTNHWISLRTTLHIKPFQWSRYQTSRESTIMLAKNHSLVSIVYEKYSYTTLLVSIYTFSSHTCFTFYLLLLH